MSARPNRMRDFIAEREALFLNPTLEAATAYWQGRGFPPPVEPDVPLAMIHKARLQWLDATDSMLAESARWLKDHSFGTMLRGGAPPLSPATRDIQRIKLGKRPLMGR